VRAAVVGCGAIGAGAGLIAHPDVGVASHAEAYRACPATELVAACDPDPERAAALGVPAYTDPHALLAEVRPQLVSVATPDATHAEVLEACLRAESVRGVLVEKPLALDVEEAEALVALARDRGVVLVVNYSRRFASAFQALDVASIGALQHVAGSYVKGLFHNGTHWLDLLRMLAGEPESARGWDRLGEGGADPTLDAELVLAGGVRAQLTGLDQRRFTAFELELTGSSGRLRIAEGGHVIERFEAGADARHPGYRVLRPAGHVAGGLRDALLHAVTDLVRCVRDGGAPACGGPDAVAALRLATAIRSSAASGGQALGCGP
jgi:predicted dehydrogenase